MLIKKQLYLDRNDIAKFINTEIFNVPISNDSTDYQLAIEKIKNEMLYGPWNNVLDIVEFMVNNVFVTDPFNADAFNSSIKEAATSFNKIFESEYVGYRFIDVIIVPFYNEDEIDTINEALNSDVDQINLHLKNVLKFLNGSDKKYKNSIAESLMAMESMAKELETFQKTLSKMLNEF